MEKVSLWWRCLRKLNTWELRIFGIKAQKPLFTSLSFILLGTLYFILYYLSCLLNFQVPKIEKSGALCWFVKLAAQGRLDYLFMSHFIYGEFDGIDVWCS